MHSNTWKYLALTCSTKLFEIELFLHLTAYSYKVEKRESNKQCEKWAQGHL